MIIEVLTPCDRTYISEEINSCQGDDELLERAEFLLDNSIRMCSSIFDGQLHIR
jgi:hypothetical protein